MVKVSSRKLVPSSSYVCEKTPASFIAVLHFVEMSNCVFVTVIYSHVSNLHSNKSGFIKIYLFYLQGISNVGNLMDFQKKKNCPFQWFLCLWACTAKWKKIPSGPFSHSVIEVWLARVRSILLSKILVSSLTVIFLVRARLGDIYDYGARGATTDLKWTKESDLLSPTFDLLMLAAINQVNPAGKSLKLLLSQSTCKPRFALLPCQYWIWLTAMLARAIR